MADIFDLADTWNNGATTFTSIKMDATDTASAADSLLMDLLVGGTSKHIVTKDGKLLVGNLNSVVDPAISFVGRSNFGFGLFANSQLYAIVSGSPAVAFLSGSLTRFGPTIQLAASNASNGGDVVLTRDGANILAQRNSTNAQTGRLYGSYTNSTNGRWFETAVTTAGVVSLTATGNGTGASGNVLHISTLPTSNPGAGILWNNAGTPAIGT